MRSSRSGLLGGVAVVAALFAVTGVANAAYVSPTGAPGMSDTNCAHAGFSKIQTAIEAGQAGETIVVCAGTYHEQLTIGKSLTLTGKGTSVIALPAVPSVASTSCDAAIEASTGEKDENLISICGAINVTLSKLTLEGKWPEVNDCANQLSDVLVAGGASLTASRVTVNGAGDFPINGCQHGVGFQVGYGYGVNEVGKATLEKVSIENFQKNAVVDEGAGSSAGITHLTVKGAGPAPIGQNGVVVAEGATANISGARISGDECNLVGTCGSGSTKEWGEDASGILFYEPGASTVSASKFSSDNIGVESVVGTGAAVTVSGSTFKGGYASVLLAEGTNTALTNDRLKEAYVGLDFLSFGGATGPTATATSDKISGTHAAIQIESSLSGIAGSLTLVTSRVSGTVDNFDPNFTITG